MLGFFLAFWCFGVVLGPSGEAQNQSKLAKVGFQGSFLSGFGLFSHLSSKIIVFFILFASKSVAFLVVFLSCFGGTFASILACLAISQDAYYTVKTNEKSTFLRFSLFHAFVKRCAFGVGFAYIS